ncbi:uncharacterized protein [Phyllobates terribilis]|uniref:uncharacterized protein n=1 Tax=Phyllobates terribilis TaxID=111132 RepID=UPI003CCA96FC
MDIDLCHQFDQLSQSHISHLEQSRHQTLRLQRKEEDLVVAGNSLEKGRSEKDALVLGIKELNTSFLECQQTARNDKEAAERSLKEVMSQKEELEKGLCPENWKMFGTKCLYFSKAKKSWEESRQDCGVQKSHMVVVQADDAELKSFIAKEQTDFWVGKELYERHRNQEWKWPKNYDINWDNTNKCWKLHEGELKPDNCWSWNKWICEKNLLPTSIRKSYSDYNFIVSLRDTEYQCKYR